jgi:hypothetical protein
MDYSAPSEKRIHSKQKGMCRLDETWHVPCGHWGVRRNVSPCAIGMTNRRYRLIGCLHSTTEGCSRVPELCPSCKYRKMREEGAATEASTPEPVQRQEQTCSMQPGMTIHGLDSRYGSLWLTKRLRRFREKRRMREIHENINQNGKRERVWEPSEESPQKRRSVELQVK